MDKKDMVGLGGQNFVFGYVDGNRYMVSNTVEQISAFIMKYRFQDVRIVNIFDQLEIETSMGFILHCPDQEFLTMELLPVLAPMQMGEADIPEFIPYVEEVD